MHSYSCGRDYCDAKEIMGVADAMAENGMRALGYQYINMDGLWFWIRPILILQRMHSLTLLLADCWADYRDDQGNIVPDPNRFPK